MSNESESNRPLNVGLVGGAKGAFIVNPQQKGVHFDGTRRVTQGALHQDPKVAMEEAANWPYPIRGFGSYDEMIAAQDTLPKEEKLDYILIVTPNNVHFDPAMKAIKKGIPVFCEKPLTTKVEDAVALAEAVRDSNVPFCLAHTYLGHWTSRLARHIVRTGLLGEVRWVDAYYIQGWLATKFEDTGNQQATWRVDPKQAGGSGCGGDIGTHALMQLRYVTGLEITEVNANLDIFVKGRKIDDHFTAYCHLDNGARALVRASQISIGHKNDLGIEVNGTKGTLRWSQENSDCLVIHQIGQPDRVYWRGAVSPNDGFLKKIPEDLMAEPTIPSGHPEAFHDAFARLHRCFEANVRKHRAGQFDPITDEDGSKYATVWDGVMGMFFLDACIDSSNHQGAWTPMSQLPAAVKRK